MPCQLFAAALLAATFSFSALAQGTTSTSCPPETGKAKARKWLGTVITDPKLRPTVTGQPCSLAFTRSPCGSGFGKHDRRRAAQARHQSHRPLPRPAGRHRHGLRRK
jgi:hypothetical protein